MPGILFFLSHDTDFPSGKVGDSANGKLEVKNKFRWAWLENVVTVDLGREQVQVCIGDFIRKIDVAGKALCIFCDDMINYGSRGYKTTTHRITETHQESRDQKDQLHVCPAWGKLDCSDGPNDVKATYGLHPVFQAQAQCQREKMSQVLVSVTDQGDFIWFN